MPRNSPPRDLSLRPADVRRPDLGVPRLSPISPAWLSPPTTGEFYQAKALTEDDIVAAVEAFMADLTTTAFLLGNGYTINLAKAVQSHEWASIAFDVKDATDHLKRAAVRTAIRLARPEKKS